MTILQKWDLCLFYSTGIKAAHFTPTYILHYRGYILVRTRFHSNFILLICISRANEWYEYGKPSHSVVRVVKQVIPTRTWVTWITYVEKRSWTRPYLSGLVWVVRFTSQVLKLNDYWHYRPIPLMALSIYVPI